MTGAIDDVNTIINGKYGLKYTGRDIDAMKAVADVYSKRSLRDFQDVLQKYHHGSFVLRFLILHKNRNKRG